MTPTVYLRLTAPTREILDAALGDLLKHDELGFMVVGEGDDAATMRALSHPARIAIVGALREVGRMSPTDFVAMQDEWSLGTVSYHFRKLADLGMIHEVATRPVRGAVEHFYGLRDAA